MTKQSPAAIVELVVMDDAQINYSTAQIKYSTAQIKYSTVQNWYHRT